MGQTTRTAAVALAFLGLLLATTTTVVAQEYWFERYQRVVVLLDDGNWEEAQPILRRLLEEHPLPEQWVRLPGSQVINYRPYYQRARLLEMKGDILAAWHSLEISLAFGEDGYSNRAARQTDELRSRLLRAGLPRQGPSRQPRPASLTERH